MQSSARFLIEHKQMEQRLRLDVPTLSDPLVRDLLQESDMFVRSFNGFSGFGMFSPFDVMRLITLASELLTHLWLLSSLTFGGTPVSVIIVSICLSALPSILSWMSGERRIWDSPDCRKKARLAAKQEAMRRLAHSDAHRPEIMLFDLGPWILKAWSRTRKALLGLERRQSGCESGLTSLLLSRVYLSGMFSAFQNVSDLLRFISDRRLTLALLSRSRFSSCCTRHRLPSGPSRSTETPSRLCSLRQRPWCTRSGWRSRACSSWARSARRPH